MQAVVSRDDPDVDSAVSWSAYHARLQPEDAVSGSDVALASLLPLFSEEAKSVAMIRHSMDVVKKSVEILNPGQIPIITVDQPLFAVAKHIQWSWPQVYGEDHFIIVFGGLHIEMAVLKVLGDLLDGSGWTSALVQADITTPGRADSLLKASHVTRTRRAHQVTASSLYLLLQRAYAGHTDDPGDGDVKPLEEWWDERAGAYPQVHFWSIILKLELAMLVYIRAVREADFQLYVDALSSLMPWFFSLDHTHYARWLPIHVRDMCALEKTHPSVYTEFLAGKFTVKKTSRRFSAIALDQAHEQNNACVKGDGGAVGLTENPAALHRWMVSGPQMAQIIAEFEMSAGSEQRTDADSRHHEENRHTQKSFAEDVKALVSTIEDMGNPFLESTSDLLVLDTRDIVDPAVTTTLNEIEEIGRQQYEVYVTERLSNRTKAITEPIKRNSLPLFSRPSARQKSKSQQQLSSLKNDCSLFSRLYIASQMREGDLDEFFAHENQANPPSLSNMGNLRGGTKSVLVGCLEELLFDSDSETMTPTPEVIILDGPAIVNMLRPGTAKTFADYAHEVFTPYVMSQLRNVSRVDVVWDEYLPDSLKAETRSKRGKGIRRRVEPSSLLPSNWQQFLRIDQNKTELFAFLSTSVTSTTADKQIISTHHGEVKCSQPRDLSALAPCTHEEADTRMILHVEDAVQNGYSKVMVRTVDTDVVVLAVTAASRLRNHISELWVAFGTGKHFRYLAAHDMAAALGVDKCIALPVFHALTGCDTVSFFGGRGKKSAWDVWKVHDAVKATFCTLASTPTRASLDDCMPALERFVVLLYDRTSCEVEVNTARKHLFTQKSRSIDALPPTRAALLEHSKRAAFMAGHCWAQVATPCPQLPSPADWGWSKNDGGWHVYWTALPEATQVCRELLRCGCKQGCRGRCKCVRAALQCTALCHCEGLCS